MNSTVVDKKKYYKFSTQMVLTLIQRKAQICFSVNTKKSKNLFRPLSLRVVKGGTESVRSFLRFLFISEASLLVPDFTISVYGSSCNYYRYIFSLLLAPLLSLSIYLHTQGGMGCQETDGERK